MPPPRSRPRPASPRSPWPGPHRPTPGTPPSPATRSSAAPPPAEKAAPPSPPCTATTYTDTTTTPGITYYYTVKAVSPLAISTASNEANATPSALAPGAPTGLSAVAGAAQIALTWTAPTNPGNPALTGYQIFRGTTPGGESSTALTTVTGTTYTDTTTTPGITYYYTVTAISPLASSTASNEATATANPLPPSPPRSMIATPGTAQITLAWTAPTNPGNPALTGYQIFRGTTPGGESRHRRSPPSPGRPTPTPPPPPASPTTTPSRP